MARGAEGACDGRKVAQRLWTRGESPDASCSAVKEKTITPSPENRLTLVFQEGPLDSRAARFECTTGSQKLLARFRDGSVGRASGASCSRVRPPCPIGVKTTGFPPRTVWTRVCARERRDVCGSKVKRMPPRPLPLRRKRMEGQTFQSLFALRRRTEPEEPRRSASR